MHEEIEEGLEELRRVFAHSRPATRLSAIRLRLAGVRGESGPAGLIANMAAVEALARSLVVHAPGRPASTAHIRYQQVREQSAPALVEEALRLHGAQSPGELFGEETFRMFALADQHRDLAVHEFSIPDREATAQMITACEQVLKGLVAAAGLLRVVPSI